MLKDLLPKLNLKLKPNPNPVVTEENPPELSPNLLDTPLESPQTLKFYRQAISSLKVFIIIVPLIFLGSLVYNDILDWRISSISTNIDSLNKDIVLYQGVADEAAVAEKKLDLYKQIKSTQPEASQKIQKIFSSLPTGVSISKLDYNLNIVSISVKSPDVLSISLLMSNYFRDNFVSEIVLKSAKLDNVKHLFLSDLDLIIK